MNKQEFENLKVGDKIYKITELGVMELTVMKQTNRRYLEFVLNDGKYFCIYGNKCSKTYYLTRAEAQAELDRLQKNKEKKRKLYEYECQLNAEMGLETFLIKY